MTKTISHFLQVFVQTVIEMKFFNSISWDFILIIN